MVHQSPNIKERLIEEIIIPARVDSGPLRFDKVQTDAAIAVKDNANSKHAMANVAWMYYNMINNYTQQK